MKELKGTLNVVINDEPWVIEFEANKDFEGTLNYEDQILFVHYACFHNDTCGGGSEKELFMFGDIKWDGCSNWMFKECEDGCYLHACTMKHVECWSKLPLICYEHALEHFELELTHG